MYKLSIVVLGLCCAGCMPTENPLRTAPSPERIVKKAPVIQPGSRVVVQDNLGINAKTMLNGDGKTQRITLTKGEMKTEFNAPRSGDITIRRKVDDNIFFIAKSESSSAGDGAVLYNLTFDPRTLKPDTDSQATLRSRLTSARTANNATPANRPVATAVKARQTTKPVTNQAGIGIRTIDNRDGRTQTIIASRAGRRTTLIAPSGTLAGGARGADGHYTVTASNGDSIVTKAKLDSYTLQPLSLLNAPNMPGALTMSTRGGISAKIQPNPDGATQTIFFSNTAGPAFVRRPDSVVHEEISPLGTHVRVTQNHQGDFVVSLHNDAGRTMRSFVLKKGILKKA